MKKLIVIILICLFTTFSYGQLQNSDGSLFPIFPSIEGDFFSRIDNAGERTDDYMRKVYDTYFYDKYKEFVFELLEELGVDRSAYNKFIEGIRERHSEDEMNKIKSQFTEIYKEKYIFQPLEATREVLGLYYLLKMKSGESLSPQYVSTEFLTQAIEDITSSFETNNVRSFEISFFFDLKSGVEVSLRALTNLDELVSGVSDSNIVALTIRAYSDPYQWKNVENIDLPVGTAGETLNMMQRVISFNPFLRAYMTLLQNHLSILKAEKPSFNEVESSNYAFQDKEVKVNGLTYFPRYNKEVYKSHVNSSNFVLQLPKSPSELAKTLEAIHRSPEFRQLLTLYHEGSPLAKVKENIKASLKGSSKVANSCSAFLSFQ